MTSSVVGLVEWLKATMQHNPMPPLRNMAYWTMDHLLDALQVSHADSMRKQLLEKARPGGVAAAGSLSLNPHMSLMPKPVAACCSCFAKASDLAQERYAELVHVQELLAECS